MHELSIATTLLETIKKTCKEHNITRIYKVHLSVGDPPSVQYDALSFCFETISKDTIAEGAELSMENTGRGIYIQKLDCETEDGC
ncbi:MAG: hydrogenase maturation nickel metallochaperone HypA [Pseudomonadota bacterium]